MEKNYSKEEWDQMIQDYRNSGLGLKKWCNKNDIGFYAMKYHLYQRNKTIEEASCLVPVIIDEEKSSSIVIKIDNASITVDQDTDLPLLKKVMEALQ